MDFQELQGCEWAKNPSKSISGTTVGQESNSNATLDACARVIEESIEANYKNWPQFPQFCTCACDFGHLVQKKHDCANFPCENIKILFLGNKKRREVSRKRRGTSRNVAGSCGKNVAERRGTSRNVAEHCFARSLRSCVFSMHFFS